MYRERLRLGYFVWNSAVGMYDIAFPNSMYGGLGEGRPCFYILMPNRCFLRTSLAWDGRAWILRGIGNANAAIGMLAKI